MNLSKAHKKKIERTTRMAYASAGILFFALGMNILREPLFGMKEGYAPHNFGFNFIFFLPAVLTALVLGLKVLKRTIKHWKTWGDSKKKWILIGLSLPSIAFWAFIILRIIVSLMN